jgi:hypothetical protein
MNVGDTVSTVVDPNFRGTVVQLPRSVGRKRPRALVQYQGGERWFFMDELKEVASGEEA